MLEILKKYWNYSTFREPQEAIIQSVLDGNDTFALLPTGGGKSICYQIPAMMKPGICLVISPLIALMKDQVAQLEKRNIKAIALTGGIHENEIIDLLDNCQFGNYKFLYLSPERLQTQWILDRIKNLPLNLIAIDEAHCVSQWGHDFRPAYLKIAELKTYFTQIPFIALTATATQRVENDVITQLQLKNPAIFKKSFARDNISLIINSQEDKRYETELILKQNPAPAIVYVTNRKSSIDIAKNLQQINITATYYHGGLSMKEKEKHMNLWLENKVQVMVATNAFGMGIDKPDVANVIHYQIPQNLENYYQEAGRGGRNDSPATATLFATPSDIIHAEAQFINNLIDRPFLEKVYTKLCSFFQIAYGEGINEQFLFNFNLFCTKYQLPTLKTFNALQFLDRQGIITMIQEFSEKTIVQFIISSKEVIRYLSLNTNDEPVIAEILRSYHGIYEMPASINIPLISRKSKKTEDEIVAILKKLASREIIELTLKNNDSQIIFNEIREDDKTINRVSKFLESQNQLKKHQLKSVLYYIQEKETCKSKLLLRYFGETKTDDCKICSVCLQKNNSSKQPKSVEFLIVTLLQNEDCDSRKIQKTLQLSKDETIFALQNLLENNTIFLKPNNTYSIKK